MQERFEDNEWVGITQILYTYNAENMFDVLSFQFWYEDEWYDSERRYYIYDENNYLTEKCFTNGSNDVEENQSRQFYENDLDSNVLVDVPDYWVNSNKDLSIRPILLSKNDWNKMSYEVVKLEIYRKSLPHLMEGLP